MVKDTVVKASHTGFAKTAARMLQAAACLTVCLAATPQIGQAQTTYYRNSPGEDAFTQGSYSYGTWASRGFVGSGYLQSNFGTAEGEETAWASWNYTAGGFQVGKGLRSLPPEDGPDQMWYPQPAQMFFTNGRGEARFTKSLNPRSTPTTSKIWSGVQGWFSGIEFYVTEKLDRGTSPVSGRTPVGSAVIDGGTYDFYTFTLQTTREDNSIYTWRQWWSVRRGAGRDSGVVNYVKHFKAWQGTAVEGVTNLTLTTSVRLPEVGLFSVSLGVEANGPSEATVWWSRATITKPY